MTRTVSEGLGSAEGKVGRSTGRGPGWVFLIGQGAWLVFMLAVGVSLVGEEGFDNFVAFAVVFMWAIGTSTIWAVRWAFRRIRSWHAIDWHAVSGAVDAHPLGVASFLVAITLVPFLIGAVLDVYALIFWGVLTAYTGVAWVFPAVFVWLGTNRRLQERGVRRHKLLAVVTSMAVALALLVANAAVIGAFDSTA